MVVIRCATDLIVGFVYGIEEVCGNNEDMYSPSMKCVFWSVGLWFWVAGTYCYAIIDRLYPSCYELERSQLCGKEKVGEERKGIHWAKMSNRRGKVGC